MGASASTNALQPEAFTQAKEEYEKKKLEGLSDEELFNHMKAFIDALIEKAPKAQDPPAEATAGAAAAEGAAGGSEAEAVAA